MSENLPCMLVVGGGNMGSAIVEGALAAGLVADRSRILVAETDPARRARAGALGVAVAASAHEGGEWLVAQPAAVLLLAVKPQSLDAAAGDLRRAVPAWSGVAISILAGTPAATVHAALGGHARVVRAMPNLPASLRMGIAAVCAGPGAGEPDLALAELVLGAVGTTVRIEEALMDAFTALAGSGPAYLFYLAEAMARAGEAMGFSPQVADAAVRQTLLGSATMLARSSERPAALRTAVTSKGGTTAAATGVLDDMAVMDAIGRALFAARDRGHELGRAARP